MAYVIKETGNNKIVLIRAGSGCNTSLFIGVGTLFFLIGVGINLLMTSWEFPFFLFRILFPLFGLGAIGLVSEPRGVIYDIVNRQRLRQFQDSERRDEETRLREDEELLGTGVPA